MASKKILVMVQESLLPYHIISLKKYLKKMILIYLKEGLILLATYFSLKRKRKESFVKKK